MKTILEEAEELVNGPRQAEYGPPADNLRRIGALWSVVLGQDVSDLEVALCMTCLKLARAMETPSRDSLVDAVGYLRLIELIGAIEDA